MKKETFTITFETITPLFTGNASGEMTKIEPSSIMGSLRFWVELFCYFSGIEGNMDSLNDSLDYKKFRNALKNSNIKEESSFETINEILADDNISIPSRIFGCTGWKSLVEISEIEPCNTFCFGNYFGLNRIYLKGSRWFFPKNYFFGEFKVKIKTVSILKKTVILPLLAFIEKYGFLGAKNNLGFGRVEIKKIVEKVENKKKKVNHNNFTQFNLRILKRKEYRYKIDSIIQEDSSMDESSKSFEFLKKIFNCDKFYCHNERDFKEKNKLGKIDKCILKFELFAMEEYNFENCIKRLLSIKSKIRKCLKPQNNIKKKKQWYNLQYKIFGNRGKHATKIIPFITRIRENDEEKYECALISIAGILNGGYNDK